MFFHEQASGVLTIFPFLLVIISLTQHYYDNIKHWRTCVCVVVVVVNFFWLNMSFTSFWMHWNFISIESNEWMNGCVFSWRIDCVFLCGNVKSHSCSHCRILIVIFWMLNCYCLGTCLAEQIVWMQTIKLIPILFVLLVSTKKKPKTTITLQLLSGGGLHFFSKVNRRMIVSNLWSTYVIESIQSDYCQKTQDSKQYERKFIRSFLLLHYEMKTRTHTLFFTLDWDQ